MAPHKEHSNVVFLFQCIESSKVKIDFGKVGTELDLKPNAARMRCARLRKVVEGELQRNSSPILSRKRRHRSTTTKTGSALKADTSDKINEKAGDDSKADVELGTDTGLRTQSGVVNLPSKRATRGNRVDYSNFDAELQSSVASDLDDDQDSEFLDARGSSSSVVTTQTYKTPPRIATGAILTPPKSRRSIKQVSVSPQPLIRRVVSSNLAARTPPYNAKRKMTPMTRDLDQEDSIRADLLDLATGQKISAVALKRRKLNIGGREDRRCITDSISPNDSISMVETEQHQTSKQMAVIQEPRQIAGTSFVQRLCNFWK